MRVKFFGLSVLLLCSLTTIGAQRSVDSIPADVQQALDHISADSLRGHLSFISSDLLEGRATPSRGLDIAAEYIAAQFRLAGLEPAGDDGYFQTANWQFAETPTQGFSFKLSNGGANLELSTRQVTVLGDKGLTLSASPILRVSLEELSAEPAKVTGKTVMIEAPGTSPFEIARRFSALNPAVVLIVDRSTLAGRGLPRARLTDPEYPGPVSAAAGPPVIVIYGARPGEFYDSLASVETPGLADIVIPSRIERPVKLKNVIGQLRGSDPVLKDSYILVTAHYDHIGVRPELEGDKIYNGANDNGSGTVSVIEIASALVKLRTRPKRSVVFMTVFAEEQGLLGSRYYGRHPVFPLEKTVANINLEMLGRTDSSEGSQVNRASLTGFDFSDLGAVFRRAGELTGIEVYKHPQNSDSFFNRSDNQALADAGVPAHTLCVAFVYPDYHRVGDHWDKIDYVNLARTDRMTALAIWMVAQNEEAPRWNEANPKTTRYVEAWRRLQRR